MNQTLLALLALTALLLPAALRAQDDNNKPVAPDRQQVREQLRNLSPEEREAKLREMRERGGFAPAGPGQRQFQGQGGAGNRLGGDIERIMMVLTPEQRESMRKANEENRDKTRELEEKVRAARRATLDAALDRKFDEAVLRQRLEAAAKLDMDLMVIRARALSKVEPPLSDEQIERAKNPPPMGDMMRQRQGQGPNGAPGERPFRDQIRPRPPSDGPRDENDLPMPVKP